MLPFLKKFFIDDPIARTKKVYFWLFNFIGQRFPILSILFHYLYVLRQLQIGKDGRVEMVQVISEFVHGCNLRCEFCFFFSPYQKGFVPADELLASYRQWGKKIKPKYFILSGGEPFLHPELVRILRTSAEIWSGSKLWITTNGLLLDRVKPDVLQAVKETGWELIISEHTFVPKHRKKLDAGYARLRQAGIPFVVRPSSSTWLVCYQYDEKGSIVPFKSNPQKAWDCCTSRHCVTIIGESLYKCSRLSHFWVAAQKGILDAEAWKAALTYQPLTLQSTPEAIVEHLRRCAVPECTVCLGKPVFVSARQLPLPKNEPIEPMQTVDTG